LSFLVLGGVVLISDSWRRGESQTTNYIVDPAANNKAFMVHKLLIKIVHVFCFALFAGSY